MGLQHHPGLVDHESRDVEAALDGFEYAHRSEQRRNEVRPCVEHHLDRFVVEVNAVLDRADAGTDGVLDTGGRLGVGHHEHVRRLRFGDTHLQLLVAEVWVARVAAR